MVRGKHVLLENLSMRLAFAVLTFSLLPAAYGGSVLEKITACDPAVRSFYSSPGVSVADDDGGSVFEIKGDMAVVTLKNHRINPEKYYRLVIKAKTTGDKPLRYMFGFVPLDSAGRVIPPDAGEYTVSGSLTELVEDAGKGDTRIRLKDASNWRVSAAHAAAFNAREDGGDIPNFELARGIDEIIPEENGYLVKLMVPLAGAYPAGTMVRQHAIRGGTYSYTGNETVNPEWTRLEGRLTRGDMIRRGTDSIRIVIMPNRSNYPGEITRVREIKLVEFSDVGSRDEYGMQFSEQFFETRRNVPAEAGGSATMIRSGPEGVRISLMWHDGFQETLSIKPFDLVMGEHVLKAAGVELSPGPVKNYVRPNIARYSERIRQEYIEKWDGLPSPAEYRFPVEFQQAQEGVGIWFDGRYAGKIENPGRMADILFEIPPGSAVGETEFIRKAENSEFLPLDLTRLPAAEALPDGAFAVQASWGGDIPFIRQGESWLDIGRSYRMLVSSSDGAIQGRSSFDGLDDSMLFSVPARQYTRAWLLCSVDDDRAKDPVITARLTRFVEGSRQGRGRDAMADVTVKLPRPGEEPGPGVTRAGVLRLEGASSPVWLVEIPLAAGEIQDLILGENPLRGTMRQIGPYLDFELLGKLVESAHAFRDHRWRPDTSSTSGVRVLGVTLEETPVEMEVGQAQPGNIFHNDEIPEVPVVLRAFRDGEYTLRWHIRDVDGQTSGGEAKVKLEAGTQDKIIIPLRQPRLGWYGLDIELRESDRVLLKYPASFALLGHDTRQAGYESPYGSWWFGSHHYGTSDEKIAGSLLKKLGFRRTHINHGADRVRLSEEILSPWGLTDAMIMWIGWDKNRGVSDQAIVRSIQNHLDRFPNTNYIMVFHESYPYGSEFNVYSQAPELIGREPLKEQEGADARWEKGLWAARLIRENFPELKIIIGNSLGSSEFIAEGLRRGFPEEYADYIGNETVNRTAVPEKISVLGTQCFWLLRETARKYGYGWGVSACFEFNYRLERLLGERVQAEWYVRDNLISLAYGAPYISTALLYDTGNNYQQSFWGGSGLSRRYPLLFPKKSYVAMSVLTGMLDRAELRREFPKGSNSVYALEFERPDGSKVYAVWTSRGTAELNISLRRGTEVKIVDMYGRSRKAHAGRRGLVMTAGTAAKYLVTPVTVDAVACGERSYPGDMHYLEPDGFRVINRMNDPDEWELAGGVDPLLENTDGNIPYRTLGDYILRGSRDSEKGAAIEVELVPDYQLPELMNEYAVIRLREPVELSGRPNTLGVWVKGNSGWGQVYFEIEDSGGTRRISCGTPVHNADVHDYDGRVSVNFDGWHFLSFPITGESPVPDLSTGAVSNLWHASSGGGLSYPIKVTGIAVSLPPRAIYLTEMNKISQVLRFRDLSVYE